MEDVPAEGFRRGLGVLVPSIRLPQDYGRVDELRRMARAGVAGFIVFGGDDELLPPLLRGLVEEAGRPLLLMTDAERGVGQQVQGCIELPPASAVGATCSEDRAYQHGRITAVEARALGINTLLAPVADLLVRPSNPIVGQRSFGANPELVAGLVAAWVAGAQEQGVLACVKHFPGHGDTTEDSHDELPVVQAPGGLLHGRELVPFRAAIRAGVGAVMTAHVAYPGLDGHADRPATLSPEILRDLLREELGFGGLVLSDALGMEGLLQAGGGSRLSPEEAAVGAVAAGCDVILCADDPFAVAGALVAAEEAGRVDLEPIGARLRLTLADLIADCPEPSQLQADYLYAAYGLARDALTALRNDDHLLPLEIHAGTGVMAILVDDDGRQDVLEHFREREDEFGAGFVHRRTWTGRGEDQAVLTLAAEAEVVFLAVASATRASKGRAALAEDLTRLVSDVLAVVGRRTVCVLFGPRAALAGVEPRPRTLVGAWGAAPVCIRAALEVVLSGGPLRGLDPAP